MSTSDKIGFLQMEIENQIDKFKTESTKHKLIYRKLRYLIFILTGSSTFLAGIAIYFDGFYEYINMGIVLMTAAVGIISSIEGLRKPSELWIMERNIYYSLLDLKREMEYHLTENANPDIDNYFNRMQSILNAGGEKWTKKFSSKQQSKD